jgi:hypothetical protein
MTEWGRWTADAERFLHTFLNSDGETRNKNNGR